MKPSLWLQNTALPSFPSLQGDIRTDVLIIGGGMAGILCACMLDRAGVDHVLVEAARIGGGTTKNTTAKITSQHGLIYHQLLKQFGPERTRMYLEANQHALEEYRRLCRTTDCGFETKPSIAYSLSDAAVIEQELAALQQIGFRAEYADRLSLPFSTAGAVRFDDQAQFHPLRFLAAISKGLHIYEHTNVRELKGMTAITSSGSIRAKKIIVATHFPFLNKHGSYFLKLYQHRSYVLALEQAAQVDGMYIGDSKTSLSFRNHGDLLLLGGGGHRTGKKGGTWDELRRFARAHYPASRERALWAAQDCMSLDGVPYIGQYSKRTPDLFVATGFNKWGMTSAMAAAAILTDLVQEKENPYAPVFSPSRNMLRPQLFVNGAETAANLLTPTPKRCPHLGCALKWNPQEQSWDCPCHGSRFTESGKLIDNPATGDLK